MTSTRDPAVPIMPPYRTIGSSGRDRSESPGLSLITSQLPIDSWHEIVGEPTFADAILDRIVHNAYRLELQGESMRKLMATEPAEAPLDQSKGK